MKKSRQLYQELQLYRKISQQTQRQEGVEIRTRTSKDIQRTKEQDYWLTSTYFIQKKRKILSKN